VYDFNISHSLYNCSSAISVRWISVTFTLLIMNAFTTLVCLHLMALRHTGDFFLFVYLCNEAYKINTEIISRVRMFNG